MKRCAGPATRLFSGAPALRRFELSSEKNSSRKPSEQACLRTPRYRRAHRGEGGAQLRYGYRGAAVGMGCSKEGPGSEVHGGCVTVVSQEAPAPPTSK